MRGEPTKERESRGREEIAHIKCVCVYSRLRVNPPKEMRRWYGVETASEREVQQVFDRLRQKRRRKSSKRMWDGELALLRKRMQLSSLHLKKQQKKKWMQFAEDAFGTTFCIVLIFFLGRFSLATILNEKTRLRNALLSDIINN